MTQEPWWPSRYGPDDEAGSLNEITAARVAAAATMVRQGRVFDLSHVVEEGIPAFPGRYFRQHLLTQAHVENPRRPDPGVAGWGHNSLKVNTECPAFMPGPTPIGRAARALKAELPR